MRIFVKLQSFALATACCLVISSNADSNKQLSDSDRSYILAETLSRLNGNLNERPELKKAVYDALPKLRGTEAFVQLVKKFGIKDQDNELLTIALANAEKDLGVEAAQLLIAHGRLDLFSAALARTNDDSLQAARVLGSLSEKKLISILRSVLVDRARDVRLRKAVLHALVQTQDGATQVLAAAKAGQLADDLKFSAGSELSVVRWSKIKTEAAELFPAVQGKDTQAFPPITALLKMRGDSAQGEKIFFRDQSMCSRCHEVRGQGGHVGPALTEIGTKLGRDALIEAILDPSAGISFGFEAFNVTMKNGDEAYGLIASETEDELAVKDLNGIVTRYKKKDVARRDQLKTSIMPTGLQQTMSPQEFVDLIEYLASLKKIEEVRK